MIVHMLEHEDVTISDLVEAVRKVELIQERHRIQHQDASRYPPSTSTSYHKPAFYKGKDKDKKDDKGNGKGSIKAKAAQMDSDVGSNTDESEDSDAERSADENALWRDGYYCCAVHNVEQTEHFFGACFNCQDEGHQWCNCPQQLRPALQEIKDKVGQDGNRLNVFGDNGSKGAGVVGGKIPHV